MVADGPPGGPLRDPDREAVELRAGPFDGGWISVGRDVPLFADGERDPTMHEYARDDTAVPVLRHTGRSSSGTTGSDDGRYE